jgi:hypothetical protein
LGSLVLKRPHHDGPFGLEGMARAWNTPCSEIGRNASISGAFGKEAFMANETRRPQNPNEPNRGLGHESERKQPGSQESERFGRQGTSDVDRERSGRSGSPGDSDQNTGGSRSGSTPGRSTDEDLD